MINASKIKADISGRIYIDMLLLANSRMIAVIGSVWQSRAKIDLKVSKEP
jgi:hypothetical protein